MTSSTSFAGAGEDMTGCSHRMDERFVSRDSPSCDVLFPFVLLSVYTSSLPRFAPSDVAFCSRSGSFVLAGLGLTFTDSRTFHGPLMQCPLVRASVTDTCVRWRSSDSPVRVWKLVPRVSWVRGWKATPAINSMNINEWICIKGCPGRVSDFTLSSVLLFT